MIYMYMVIKSLRVALGNKDTQKNKNQNMGFNGDFIPQQWEFAGLHKCPSGQFSKMPEWAQ